MVNVRQVPYHIKHHSAEAIRVLEVAVYLTDVLTVARQCWHTAIELSGPNAN